MVRERENKLAALRERKPETTAFGVEKKKKKPLTKMNDDSLNEPVVVGTLVQ